MIIRLRQRIATLAALCFQFGAVTAHGQEPEMVWPTQGALFIPGSGSGYAAVEEVGRDEIIAAVPVRFREVARLRREVHENSALVMGHHALPAGSPLFSASFTPGGVAWCGVSVTRATYCVFGGGERARIGLAGDAYVPNGVMAEPYPASFFDVVADPSAAEEFPPLELVYLFREWDRRDADVRVGVRVNGGSVSVLNDLSVPRSGDGTATLRVAGGQLRLTESGRRGAQVTALTPPRDLAGQAGTAWAPLEGRQDSAEAGRTAQPPH